jgi:hypothetical protein
MFARILAYFTCMYCLKAFRYERHTSTVIIIDLLSYWRKKFFRDNGWKLMELMSFSRKIYKIYCKFSSLDFYFLKILKIFILIIWK